jgi:pimeloyl-ACP methyl ester carboxylesterase
MRTFAVAVVLASALGAAPQLETGEINGAQFRIDVPERWNGVLLMYCHGYSPAVGKFGQAPPNPLVKALMDSGYAIAQSGYAAGGWAIEEAVLDTQTLRRYFVRKYGAPKETLVLGHSMGGFLTMKIMETFPNDYEGGLALCGPLAAAQFFITRRVFDPLVVFAYLFPGALPDPGKVPPDYALSRARDEEVQKLLDGQEEKAGTMRRWMGIRTNKELAATMTFFTYVLKDLQERGGGNPFDNRNTIYDGLGDDLALNAGVKRYESHTRAVEYLRTYYTPTGQLSRPMLAINNVYDPLVPPWVANMYSLLTEQAGSAGMFVQQYARGAGHCNFTPAETVRGIEQVREWKGKGVRPAAGPTGGQ